MKSFFNPILLILILIFGCQSADDSQYNFMNGEGGILTKTISAGTEDQPCFSIEIPSEMKPMNEISADAILQYGYANKKEVEGETDETREYYIMVLMESKSDISAYPVDIKIDLKSYHQQVCTTMRLANGAGFEFQNPNETIQKINNVSMIRSEATFKTQIRSRPSEIAYLLAVIEGEDAYYQLLTWCPKAHLTEFKPKMEVIINSFKEL